MKIIEQSYDIRRFDYLKDIAAIAEAYALCYGSPPPETYEEQCAIIRRHRNEGSPLEHSIMTVRFTINRGISHEMVRHRHCAYSQQSTRYCNFSKNKFGNEITFIKDSRTFESAVNDIWLEGLSYAENEYFARLNAGQMPEEARGCLPNDLSTQLMVSTNIREWRSIFSLRCDKRAHYQMREIMIPLLEDVTKKAPCLFDDISYK